MQAVASTSTAESDCQQLVTRRNMFSMLQFNSFDKCSCSSTAITCASEAANNTLWHVRDCRMLGNAHLRRLSCSNLLYNLQRPRPPQLMLKSLPLQVQSIIFETASCLITNAKTILDCYYYKLNKY
eukprot:10867-Heterococcus_DN1.PRE.7